MQQLVWGHKENLNSIDRLSCHCVGCMQSEGATLYRSEQQPKSGRALNSSINEEKARGRRIAGVQEVEEEG